MLGRLLNTRLRTAENALRQSQLDEAYRIATAPDIREHRRGMALLGQLAERFVERAREHFASDRFAEALCDLDRAESTGFARDRVSELREQINTVAAEVARRQRSRRDRLDQARRRVAEGSLEAGQRILDAASQGDAEADKMKREIQMRDQEASQVFAQARQLLRDGQWITAVERLAKAKSLDPHDPACAKLEAELCDRILKSTRQSLKDGRIERAADELACLGELGKALPSKREIEEILRLIKQAGDALRSGDYDGARQNAMRLGHLAPEIRWVSKVAEQLGSIDKMVTALRAGPLGAFADASPPAVQPRRTAASKPGSLAETVALPSTAKASALPDRILLLVDGGGSYLLLRKERISIGKAATSNPADVAIFADLADRHAEIARVDDDYFLFSPQEIEIGGKPTRHQLLQDGDRVVLGRKGKFTFRLPNRKSPSATMDLSDTSKLPNDVRRVVLFAKNAMIGYGKGFHMHCQMARNPLVLFERDGALWVRLSGRGRAASDAVRLNLGETIELEGVSMVAKPWSVRPGGMSRL